MNEEFYKEFLNYLVREIDGLWYDPYTVEDYVSGEETTFYSWGYIPQTYNEEEIDDYSFKSYERLAEDIVKHLKVVK